MLLNLQYGNCKSVNGSERRVSKETVIFIELSVKTLSLNVLKCA